MSHEQAELARAVAILEQGESALRHRLESLRDERNGLLDASEGLRAWSASVRSQSEQSRCGCLEHDVPAGHRPQVAPITPRPEPVQSRPTREELRQLRKRCEHVRGQLEAAIARWREARNAPSSFPPPEDIQGLEQQIDTKKVAIGDVDARLEAHQQRWCVLSVTGEVIRRAAERIEQGEQPDVIQWASQYFSRLTAGRFTEVEVISPQHTLIAVEVDGSHRSLETLSRGTLAQLDLSLRLALIRAYAKRGIRYPLLLDDVLTDTDQERLKTAVDLLVQFSEEHETQIFYLTCQTHLVALFRRHGAPVRSLPGSAPLMAPTLTEQQTSAGSIRGWVDWRSGDEVVPAEPTTVERTTTMPTEESAGSPRRNVRLLRPLRRRQPGGPYWLSVDSPVGLVPSIGSQMGRRLAGLGVTTTGDLIDVNADDLSLRLASLQISQDCLSDWKSEAVLLCCVPDLTGPDAQWLARCGVTDAASLANANVDELVARLRRLREDPQSESLRSGLPNRDTVRSWIHQSRRARPLQKARRSGRRRHRISSSGRSAASAPRRGGRRSARPAPASPSRRRSQRRPQPTRRSQSHRHSSGGQSENASVLTRPLAPVVSLPTPVPDSSDLRFYLSSHSPVVDAPSIGPTTSQRLERIGVLTVADLINRDAGEIATRLRNRRIKEETVLLWQRQARLMCRIPQLRGHDARVLIACGITEPEQMANMAPSDLFAVVGPFVKTKEGRRLLRSSNAPDLEEVTDWINWSHHSRQLRAA